MESSEDDSNITVKEETIEAILQWGSNHRSAFTPYKNVTTVLTNLQRGNIETTTTRLIPEEVSFHVRAAMGSLTKDDFTPDIDLNEVDERKLTPLMWASAYGQLPTAKLIIQKGAEVDFEGESGHTALVMAASYGHHEVVRMLLSSGADPNHKDKKGNTALMYGCHTDHPHCVSELLENGSDLTITNDEGNTAFNMAVTKGNKQAQVVLERFILRLLESS